MRRLFLLLWLVLPLGGAAYHYGPGQDRLAEDRVARASELGLARAAEARSTARASGDDAARPLWEAAERAFDEALLHLPKGNELTLAKLRLERAKAQLNISKLPTARGELDGILRDLELAGADDALLDDARETLANAQYYNTWLLRLEGEPRDVWEPEIEAARQNFRLGAERAETRGEAERAAEWNRSLESALRLARMDLTELQGLPLPSV